VLIVEVIIYSELVLVTKETGLCIVIPLPQETDRSLQFQNMLSANTSKWKYGLVIWVHCLKFQSWDELRSRAFFIASLSLDLSCDSDNRMILLPRALMQLRKTYMSAGRCLCSLRIVHGKMVWWCISKLVDHAAFERQYWCLTSWSCIVVNNRTAWSGVSVSHVWSRTMRCLWLVASQSRSPQGFLNWYLVSLIVKTTETDMILLKDRQGARRTFFEP
jgi:hypothetical protein